MMWKSFRGGEGNRWTFMVRLSIYFLQSERKTFFVSMWKRYCCFYFKVDTRTGSNARNPCAPRSDSWCSRYEWATSCDWWQSSSGDPPMVLPQVTRANQAGDIVMMTWKPPTFSRVLVIVLVMYSHVDHRGWLLDRQVLVSFKPAFGAYDLWQNGLSLLTLRNSRKAIRVCILLLDMFMYSTHRRSLIVLMFFLWSLMYFDGL